jgi:hypothetical protein
LKKPDNMPDLNEKIRLDDEKPGTSQDKKQDG